ncbi:MFS transporter [Apodospora peruviana]|uniref:MFS transporter n=1 Tax=Apodospora peruviana TaxID=516989 RepID=A0AAE0I1J3_9PEZI|nr:MFS transporter [Apodospora peruviana]
MSDSEKGTTATTPTSHVTDKRQFNWYNVFMVVVVSWGAFAYGYSTAIIGPTLAQPSFEEYFELETRPNANALISTMSGLYSTGGFLGVFTVPWVADKFGRKWGIVYPTIFTLISGAFCAGSTNIGEFILFRFISGAGAFMLLAAVPIWVNEVVPPKTRGGFITLMGLMLLAGYNVALWASYGFFFFRPTANNQWRAPLGLQCLPATIVLVCMPWIPESPRWLVMKDRIEDARAVLRKLHEPDEAEVEMRQIQAQISIDRTLPNGWMVMLFKKPSYRKRSMLGFGTTASIQFSGILVINIYGPTIYASLGYGVSTQLLLAACWVGAAFVGSVLSMFIVDRVPRPKLMAGGMIACVIVLIVECILIAQNPIGPNVNTAALKAAVAMIFLYVVCYEFMNNVQLGFLGEIFPFHLRSKGIALGVSGICLLNIIWLQAAPTALENIGWKYYLCFIIPSSIAAVLILLFWPDTNGMPLEEVARLFGDEEELFGENHKHDADHAGAMENGLVARERANTTSEDNGNTAAGASAAVDGEGKEVTTAVIRL